MRGKRRVRRKEKAQNAATLALLLGDSPSPVDAAPVDPEPQEPVEALIVTTEEPVRDSWSGRVEPSTAIVAEPPGAATAPLAPTPMAPVPMVPVPVAATPESQTEILRLLDVVTNMCDHVIEYIEADRAERQVMLETLTQLGRVLNDGAAAIAAASAHALAAQVSIVSDATTGAGTDAAIEPPAKPEPFAFAMRERVIGGSMPAGPEPVIDLVEPEPELEPEPTPEPQPEFATAMPSSSPTPTPATMEIAVEVRGRFGDRWVDGFEICEVMTTPEGPRYRLRRQRDGVVLPELFDATNIRHVETFDQLSAAYSAHPAGKNRINGNGSPGYWSRS